jgi:hypothetical protein
MKAGLRFLAAVLMLGAAWDFFTTLYGLAAYFDLPLNPGINPVQFSFAMVLTCLVFTFVLATEFIWTIKHDDMLVQILKAAWGVCIAITLITSWQGTKHYVFYGDDGDAARGIGLALATVLTVISTVLLSRLVMGGHLWGNASAP